jgi:hypothetical protein
MDYKIVYYCFFLLVIIFIGGFLIDVSSYLLNEILLNTCNSKKINIEIPIYFVFKTQELKLDL